MLQRSTRHFMTMAIALAFAFAIVPRGWLHRCDQAQVDHHHPDHAALYADLDCEVCSVEVTAFDGRITLPGLPAAVALGFEHPTSAPASQDGAFEETRTRGPPLS